MKPFPERYQELVERERELWADWTAFGSDIIAHADQGRAALNAKIGLKALTLEESVKKVDDGVTAIAEKFAANGKARA